MSATSTTAPMTGAPKAEPIDIADPVTADPGVGGGVGGGDAPGDEHPPRRRRLGVVAAIVVVGLAIVGLAVAIGVRVPPGGTTAPSPLIGEHVPLRAGSTVSGAAFDPASLSGHFAVVNFFASWCVPCRKEHPALVAFARRHQGDGVALVSVVFQDDDAKAAAFFAAQGGTWPVVRDPDGRTALDFGVTGVPESYLVDPAGIVVAKLVGGVNADSLDALIVAHSPTATPAAPAPTPPAATPPGPTP